MRRLGVTPAAVSRNVANLERSLGVRLFQRSSRSLTLTEDGQRFLASISDDVQSIQSAIAQVTTQAGKPVGVLKVSTPSTFGQGYLMPRLSDANAVGLPGALSRRPAGPRFREPDRRRLRRCHQRRHGIARGIVAQRLAPFHVIAVASPEYLQGRPPPQEAHELAALDGLSMRLALTGRVRVWRMRNREGAETTLEHKARIVANDPEALCRAALMGLDVAMIAAPYVEQHLESGALLRPAPDWYADLGAISLYFTGQKLLAAKTRAFVDHVTAAFHEQNLARRFSAEE